MLQMRGNYGSLGGGGQPSQRQSIIPETLKKDDVELLCMKLREILTPTFKEPNLRLITANSMKGRNYIFFDQLGKIFDYYEEKNKSDQLTQA
jgi:hypothetical protein